MKVVEEFCSIMGGEMKSDRQHSLETYPMFPDTLGSKFELLQRSGAPPNLPSTKDSLGILCERWTQSH